MGHGAEAGSGDADAFDDNLVSDLVDLSDVPFGVVADMPESALAYALRRIHWEAIQGVVAFSTDYDQKPPYCP